MAPNALEEARARYTAAYEAYQKASRPVAEKLSKGLVPSAEDVAAEAKAIELLAAARRRLLDVMATLAPRR